MVIILKLNKISTSLKAMYLSFTLSQFRELMRISYIFDGNRSRFQASLF